MKKNLLFILIILLFIYEAFADETKRASQNTTQLYYLPNSLTNVSKQSQSLLGDKLVPTTEYEAALPFINDTQVCVRDYPTTKDSEIRFLLDKNVIVDIRAMTIEEDSINGEIFPWYSISLRGEGKNGTGGWIFGKYLTFKKGFGSEFWEIKKISRNRYIRPMYIENLFKALFKNDGSWHLNIKKLDKYKLTSSTKNEEGYFSGTKSNYYETEFGFIEVILSEGSNIAAIYNVIINKSINDCTVKVGETKEVLEKILGSDYTQDDKNTNKIAYSFNEEYDSYAIEVLFENNKIKEFLFDKYLP